MEGMGLEVPRYLRRSGARSGLSRSEGEEAVDGGALLAYKMAIVFVTCIVIAGGADGRQCPFSDYTKPPDPAARRRAVIRLRRC